MPQAQVVEQQVFDAARAAGSQQNGGKYITNRHRCRPGKPGKPCRHAVMNDIVFDEGRFSRLVTSEVANGRPDRC